MSRPTSTPRVVDAAIFIRRFITDEAAVVMCGAGFIGFENSLGRRPRLQHLWTAKSQGLRPEALLFIKSAKIFFASLYLPFLAPYTGTSVSIRQYDGK